MKLSEYIQNILKCVDTKKKAVRNFRTASQVIYSIEPIL
jgi:hypothetical protein